MRGGLIKAEFCVVTNHFAFQIGRTHGAQLHQQIQHQILISGQRRGLADPPGAVRGLLQGEGLAGLDLNAGQGVW